METLSDWIERKLIERGWRPADLARAAKVTDATMSRILSGSRNAGPDFCLAIANALKVPPEKVFRLAGLLPSLPAEDSPILQEIQQLAQHLSEENQRDVLDYIRYRYSRQLIRDDDEYTPRQATVIVQSINPFTPEGRDVLLIIIHNVSSDTRDMIRWLLEQRYPDRKEELVSIFDELMRMEKVSTYTPLRLRRLP